MDLSAEFVEAVILPELDASRGPFGRIWIYERIRGTVLWRHRRESKQTERVVKCRWINSLNYWYLIAVAKGT